MTHWNLRNNKPEKLLGVQEENVIVLKIASSLLANEGKADIALAAFMNGTHARIWGPSGPGLTRSS